MRTTTATTGTSKSLLAVIGLVVALAHAAALPPTLEDLDSVNFALGVESFDVSKHRPHPPGYPLYIAAGKASDAAVSTLAPEWSRDQRAAAGLAVWSIAASVVAVWVLHALWSAVGLSPTQSLLATVLALASPLFWLTASRPLTDVPGLVAALAVQAGFFSGLRLFRASGTGGAPTVWWWAAAGAGLIIGLRTQTMWLTGPLLCWCAGELAARGRWRDVAGLVASGAAGGLAWCVPMLIVSGGWDAYLAVLGAQGAEDFIGVEMLATRPSWPLFVEALSRTFVAPWLNETLAWVVLGLAALGTLRLFARSRGVLALLVLAFWPYCVFHLTFQETATLRYALPMVVPTAALAIVAIAALARPAAIAAGLALIAATLWVAQPPLAAYGAAGAPIFRAFADLEATVRVPSGAPTPPTALGMHRRVASEARQAVVWAGEAWPFRLLPTEWGGEVAAVVDYWRQGGVGPVWFLANPVRRDLALIDARARRLHARYAWHPDTRRLVALARPADVDAWNVGPPRWMLGRGWAVTPEIGGATSALGLGPHREPAHAYLRRDPAPLRVVIGGRQLGTDGFARKTLVARLDGQEVGRWLVTPPERHFLHWIDLPSGVPAGEGPYATLSVGVENTPRSRPVGLEFFDAATYDDVLWVYARGWHEPEQQPGTGLSWRWMSGVGHLTVAAPPGDLMLTISGESPARYFAKGTDLIVRAGDIEVARRHIRDDFTESVVVPAAALAAARGDITLEVSDIYVPADRGESADRRQLSLRVFDLRITRVP